MEHTETAVDEQNNPSDEKPGNKMPNITIISDNSPINTMTSKFFIYSTSDLYIFFLKSRIMRNYYIRKKATIGYP